MVSNIKQILNPRTKRLFFVLGIALLVVTALIAVAALAGLARLPEQLFAGESTVHTVARVAIIGCLLAAVGSIE